MAIDPNADKSGKTPSPTLQEILSCSAQDRFRLLIAGRQDVAAAGETAGEGPFVCWGRFTRQPTEADLVDVEARVLELARDCIWPTTFHDLSAGHAIERLTFGSGDSVWIVDWDRRGERFLHMLVGSVAGRLSPEDVPNPELEPYLDGLLFLQRRLHEAGRLHTENRGEGRLCWYQGDGFHATLAALDAVAGPTVAVEWSIPRTIQEWAKVYGVSRNTMPNMLAEQKPRNQKAGSRYMVAIDDLPATHRDKNRGAGRG